MPSPAYPTPSEQNLSAITAEGATLPVIRAAGFEARVNAYVVGRTERTLRTDPHRLPNSEATASRSPGCSGGATDLWYLSLVAPRGHGTTLRAIWANLVGNTRHAVWLEGVGMVALGHQRLDLNSSGGSGGLGYPIHWTYRQAVVPPSRDVQVALESDLLTCYDPLLAPVVSRAPRAERGKSDTQQASARARADRASMMLTSAASIATSANSGQDEETHAREAHPLFLLLSRARSGEQLNQAGDGTSQEGDMCAEDGSLARLHLRYLATRIPWLPYYPTWAEYLWSRALAQGEVEPLHVWSYGGSRDYATASLPERRGKRHLSDEAASQVDLTTPYLTAAYLCRPNPLALTADLSHAIASGTFGAPRPSVTTLRASSEDERAA